MAVYGVHEKFLLYRPLLVQDVLFVEIIVSLYAVIRNNRDIPYTLPSFHQCNIFQDYNIISHLDIDAITVLQLYF